MVRLGGRCVEAAIQQTGGLEPGVRHVGGGEGGSHSTAILTRRPVGEPIIVAALFTVLAVLFGLRAHRFFYGKEGQTSFEQLLSWADLGVIRPVGNPQGRSIVADACCAAVAKLRVSTTG